jgi:hypothetical protein
MTSFAHCCAMRLFRTAILNVLLGLIVLASHNVMADTDGLEMRIIDEPPLVASQIVTVEFSLQSESPIVGAAEFTLPLLDFGVWLEQSRASYNGFAMRGNRRVPTLVTTYAMWVQKVGTFQLPSVQVKAPMLINGEKTYLTAETQAVPLIVQYPQAQSERQDFLVAEAAEITSSVDSSAELSVGQIIEHTLTISARGALPASFPAVNVASSHAYKVDQLPVSSTVEYTRGVVTSTKTVTLRYLLLESGAQQLPSYSLDWWDTRLHQFRTVRSRPHEIEVRDLTSKTDAVVSGMDLVWVSYILLGLLTLWLLARYKDCLMNMYKKIKAPVLPERLNP